MTARKPRLLKPAIASAVLLVAVLTAPPRDVFAQAREMTLEELTTTSTAVVLGRAESSRSFWNDARTQILTEVRIRVDESVKGGAGGETVVTIPGGRVGNTAYEVSDMPVFVDGEQVLVFLWEHPSGRQLVTAGAYGKLDVVESTGEPVVRGAAALVKEDRLLGKSAAPDDIVRVTGDVPVADVLTQIRTYVSNE